MHTNNPECHLRQELVSRERRARLAIAIAEARGAALPIDELRAFLSEQTLRLAHEGRCKICREAAA